MDLIKENEALFNDLISLNEKLEDKNILLKSRYNQLYRKRNEDIKIISSKIHLLLDELINAISPDFDTESEFDKQDNFISTCLYYHLTSREIEVLELYLNNKTNFEIGEILSISYNTIKSHKQHINQKLGTINIIELLKLFNLTH